MENLQRVVEGAWERREHLTRANVERSVEQAVLEVIDFLDRGRLRVAEKVDGRWQVHHWIKKAVLLYFKLQETHLISGGFTHFYDKVPLKYSTYSTEDFKRDGVRVVPHGVVRKGSYLAPGVILMPSYVNIGAYVDSGTLVDTWATVGSCAQIGKQVHLSGGAGIGGVLEPIQANPVIVEDGAFIGARSEIVEGVIVGEGAVIGMGVYLGASTKIYNRQTGEVLFGHVPPYSVVVSGSLPAKDGTHSLYAAIIVKQVDEKTRAKTSINDLLRE
jgi:2,3,4,5-tetrahydropyridine-2-carboxylate N-succinyltransferase